MSERKIKEFKGSYGRRIKIWTEMAICDLCGEKKVCIASDGSEHEYENAKFCSDCVKIACDKFI